MSVAVEVRGLSFRYGDREALRDVSFDVQPGDVHAFLGPNGSGKSTLFKLLATILPPQSGTARVLGRDLATQMAEVRRLIGVVFQAPALDRKLTVRQNLNYGGHLYGLRGADLARRVEEMLEHTGLTERAGDRVERLSGGLKRRVELAKGLLSRPQILLLDEPTTGLDPGARKDLWQFLRSQEDLTVLATTHIMDEADLADRITILHEGQVVAAGTPRELVEDLGDMVLEVTSSDAAALEPELARRFGVEVFAFDHTLRLQVAEAHRIVGELVDEFGERVERVALSHPSLEDVFIRKTGHRFWAEKEEA